MLQQPGKERSIAESLQTYLDIKQLTTTPLERRQRRASSFIEFLTTIIAEVVEASIDATPEANNQSALSLCTTSRSFIAQISIMSPQAKIGGELSKEIHTQENILSGYRLPLTGANVSWNDLGAQVQERLMACINMTTPLTTVSTTDEDGHGQTQIRVFENIVGKQETVESIGRFDHFSQILPLDLLLVQEQKPRGAVDSSIFFVTATITPKPPQRDVLK